MTYAGHRVHPRRRLAPGQARRAPERADLDDLTPAPAPPVEPEAVEPAPPDARAFVEALALAVSGVPLAEHTGDQLDHLRAVLAVAAPGITLTDLDPDPQETPVPTTTEPAAVVEHALPDPVVDEGQGETLDELFAALALERAATAHALAERDRLLAATASPFTAGAQAVRAITAARARAEDEHAIALLREQLADARQRTAVTLAHLILALAGVALAERDLPATQAEALALIATVPLDDLVVAVGGRVDVEAAAAALADAAARRAGTTR